MSVTLLPSASGENSSILVVWFESMCVNNCTSNWNIYRVTSHCSLSLSASWLLYVLQLVKRHCVSVCVCVCVYYIYMCMARLWLVNVTVSLCVRLVTVTVSLCVSSQNHHKVITNEHRCYHYMVTKSSQSHHKWAQMLSLHGHDEWAPKWYQSRNHPKSSLSQQRNRLDAITTGISCDFLRFLSKKVMISAITETKRGEKAGFLWSSLFLKLSETL